MYISIIIPCHNVEKYIDECVKSVLTQDYKQIEIICIDNNSTDGTWEKLENLKQQYPQIIIDRELKRGAPAARNKGLSLAKGEYVQFLDADDLLLPEKLRTQADIIKNGHSDIIAGACIQQNKNKESVISPSQNDKWESLIKVELGNTCANLWKREKLLEINGWDESLKSSQEYDLLFRLLKKGASVSYDLNALTIIRKREGSITTTNIGNNILTRIDLVKSIRDYLKINNYKNEVINTADQMIFDLIRELYNYNEKLSLEIYNSNYTKMPKIIKSKSTNNLYVKLFSIFGFRITQKIVALYKKF
jgi:glycosyltransferase involved in cell wall biosynthesis